MSPAIRLLSPAHHALTQRSRGHEVDHRALSNALTQALMLKKLHLQPQSVWMSNTKAGYLRIT